MIKTEILILDPESDWIFITSSKYEITIKIVAINICSFLTGSDLSTGLDPDPSRLRPDPKHSESWSNLDRGRIRIVVVFGS